MIATTGLKANLYLASRKLFHTVEYKTSDTSILCVMR